MSFKFYQLYSLTSSMFKANKDIEHFKVHYSNLEFDIIYDIGVSPYEMLIGAINANWACVLKITKGFETNMDSSDFFKLCDLLNLKPSKETLTSFKFLQSIATQFPKKCSNKIVNPIKLIPFRQHQIKKSDEPNKIYFYGWNDHKIDKLTAHNFDKTELLLGKTVADYCRQHNISSRWTDKIHNSKDTYYPWEHEK